MFKKIFPGSAQQKQEASNRHVSSSYTADLDSASSSETENSDNHCKPRAENLEDYEGSELVHGILSQSSSDDDDSSASEYSRGYGSDYDDEEEEEEEGMEGVLQMGCMDVIFLPNSMNNTKKSLVKVNKKGDRELNLNIKGPLALRLESQMKEAYENQEPNTTKSLSSVLNCRTPKGRVVPVDHSLLLTEQSPLREPESNPFKSLMSLSHESSSSCDEDCDSNIIKENFILPPPLPPFQIQASYVNPSAMQNYHNHNHNEQQHDRQYYHQQHQQQQHQQHHRNEHNMFAPVNYPYEKLVNGKVDPYHAKSPRNLPENHHQGFHQGTSNSAKATEPPLIEKMPSQILVQEQHSCDEAEESCLSYEVITAPDPPEASNPYRSSGPHNSVRYQEEQSGFPSTSSSSSPEAIVNQGIHNMHQINASPHLQVQGKQLLPIISKSEPNKEKGIIHITKNEAGSDSSIVTRGDSISQQLTQTDFQHSFSSLSSKAKVQRWRKANIQRLKQRNLSLTRDEGEDIGLSVDSDQAIAEEDLEEEEEDHVTETNLMTPLQQPIDLKNGNDDASSDRSTTSDPLMFDSMFSRRKQRRQAAKQKFKRSSDMPVVLESKSHLSPNDGSAMSAPSDINGGILQQSCTTHGLNLPVKSSNHGVTEIQSPCAPSVIEAAEMTAAAAKQKLKRNSDMSDVLELQFHPSSNNGSTISATSNINNDGILLPSCTHDLNLPVNSLNHARTPSVIKAAETAAAAAAVEAEAALQQNYYSMEKNIVDEEDTENNAQAHIGGNNNTFSKKKETLKGNLSLLLPSFQDEGLFPVLTTASSTDATILEQVVKTPNAKSRSKSSFHRPLLGISSPHASSVSAAAVPMAPSPRHSLSRITSPRVRKDNSSSLSIMPSTTDWHDTEAYELSFSEYGNANDSSRNIGGLYSKPTYTSEWHDTIQSLSSRIIASQKSPSGTLTRTESTLCTDSTEGVYSADEFFEANMFNEIN
ncbi:MAG: hypothetical protein ACI90V_012467 [Bacillariaceae sp.]|jgi:hypothetical protein